MTLTSVVSDECSMTDSRMRNSSQYLVKVFEHTWGVHRLSDITQGTWGVHRVRGVYTGYMGHVQGTWGAHRVCGACTGYAT